MDRRQHTLRITKLAVIGGMLAISSVGCRSTRNEVPPGRPYQTVGNPPTVGFSSEPHQNAGQGMAGLYGNRGGGAAISDGAGSPRPGDVVLGTPTQNTTNLGVPSDHQYGAPGTAGSAGTPTLGDSVARTIPSGADIVKQDLKASPASTSPYGDR